MGYRRFCFVLDEVDGKVLSKKKFFDFDEMGNHSPSLLAK
jgi:hypothetical protein